MNIALKLLQVLDLARPPGTSHEGMAGKPKADWDRVAPLWGQTWDLLRQQAVPGLAWPRWRTESLP